MALVACGGADDASNVGSPNLQLISGDTGARIDVGSSKSVTAQHNQTVAQVELGTLPVGLSITSRISGSMVQMTATVQPEFSFVSSPEISVPVQLTLTDANGGKLTGSVVITALDMMPNAIADLLDLKFSDGAGSTHTMLTNDGGYPPFPLPANQITNPSYSPVNGFADPNNSYWSINVAATDRADRTLTYSIQVSAIDGSSLPADAVSMASNLVLNSLTGSVTQKCNGSGATAKVQGLPYCYDSDSNFGEFDVFKITITASATNGYKKLIRTFKISVRDDG